MAGPLLQKLLEAQRMDEATVAYPSIESIAESLATRAHDLAAVVWPVGAAAERVAGAATVLAEGAIEVAAWNRRLDGECVLLFAVSGATPLSLAAAAAQVRSMGAAEVHACGVGVAGAESCDKWQSFIALEPAPTPRMLQPAFHAP
jgi:hypothetical protein